jgi:hypothetical protein
MFKARQREPRPAGGRGTIVTGRAVTEGVVGVTRKGRTAEPLLTKPDPFGVRAAGPPVLLVAALVVLVAFVVPGIARGHAGSAVLLLGEAAFLGVLAGWVHVGWRSRHLFMGGAAAVAAVVLWRSAGDPANALNVRDNDLQWGVGLLAVAAVILVLDRRVHRGVPGYTLASPLGARSWVVVHGGHRSLNHHARIPEQRFALDLVAARAVGARSRPVRAGSLEDHLGYGAPVHSPVEGTVVHAENGRPDLGEPWPVYGNHVAVEPDDRPGWRVVLAHLRPGSVAVAAGQRVVVGQLLGEVGNSGNSSEPHLHLHVEDDGGLGVPMRIGGRRPLHRNDRLPPMSNRHIRS